MKKVLLVLFIALTLGSVSVFAQHDKDATGVGVVFGGGWGGYGYNLYPGLSLHLPSIPDMYWGVYGHISRYGFGVGVTGDYYLFDQPLVENGGFKLDWYLGLGGFADLYFWSYGLSGDVGVRVPIGLAWHITRPVELFLGVAPGVGLGFGPGGLGLHWAGNAELGLRFWF
jgi:hypothetical protein